MVINNWKDADSGAEGNVMGNKTSVAKDGKIKLKAGEKYAIRVEYYENRRNASLHFYWSTKKMEKEIQRINAATVGDLYSENVITVDERTPVVDIATIMSEKRAYTIPVMDGERMMGIIGKADLIRTLVP